MNKKHRRNIKRLAKKFNISIDDSISKFYKDQTVDKNAIFSILKKRSKGKRKKSKIYKKKNNLKVSDLPVPLFLNSSK
jgi:hypothetical protein